MNRPHPIRLARSILAGRRLAVARREPGITRVWPNVIGDWVTVGWSRGISQPTMRRISREHRADEAREIIDEFLDYAASEEVFLIPIGSHTGNPIDAGHLDALANRWTRYHANFRTWPRWLVRVYLLRFLVLTRVQRGQDGTVVLDGWRINTAGRRPLLLRYFSGMRAEGYAGAQLIETVRHQHYNPVPIELRKWAERAL